jgi:nucleotide-binding universal stress UspA family protein
MNKVYACIDGLANTPAVIDWAVWSAQALDVPLTLLHVLERPPERAVFVDYSGALGLGAQDSLLYELSELDEQQARLAQESGRRVLLAAQTRATAAGLTEQDGRLAGQMRHGDLADTALELEPDARLFVLGMHARGEGSANTRLDHHVESLIRTVQRPVLVVPGETFTAPERVVIAFDGSLTARHLVAKVAASPLLTGLPLLVVMAGAETPLAREQLADAQRTLELGGFQVSTLLIEGEPEQVLPPLLTSAPGAALLVMGAYGHSRIRQFIVGSTTTTLLRSSEVPVLILR